MQAQLWNADDTESAPKGMRAVLPCWMCGVAEQLKFEKKKLLSLSLLKRQQRISSFGRSGFLLTINQSVKGDLPIPSWTTETEQGSKAAIAEVEWIRGHHCTESAKRGGR